MSKLYFLISAVALFSATARGSESCFNDAAGQGVYNGERTECVEFVNLVPGYIVYPENGISSNATPLAVAFVKDKLEGFDLQRDIDLENSCPTFFNLDLTVIDNWITSTNSEDLINALNDICFTKFAFVEKPEKTFSYRIVYKVSSEPRDEGKSVYKPRKLAVSTPGGNDFVFVDHTEDLAGICTTCTKTDSNYVTNDVQESSNLADVLNGLKQA